MSRIQLQYFGRETAVPEVAVLSTQRTEANENAWNFDSDGSTEPAGGEIQSDWENYE